DFPIPVVAAEPGPVVPWNGSVRLRCRGTPGAFLYLLLFLGNATHRVVKRRLGIQEEAEFLLAGLDASSAGPYGCQYRKQLRWSEQSPALELVVTGLYEKPVLSTDKSPVLALGSYVSLWCGSPHIPFDSFSLAKEGVASSSQHQHTESQGNFTLGPVNPSFAGEYRPQQPRLHNGKLDPDGPGGAGPPGPPGRAGR
uniref:Uncharacterized protein n=1 Tax=Sciurus vulgaris TaxID=55149 RepID=A0A8D2DJH6_SCIVU